MPYSTTHILLTCRLSISFSMALHSLMSSSFQKLISFLRLWSLAELSACLLLVLSSVSYKPQRVYYLTLMLPKSFIWHFYEVITISSITTIDLWSQHTGLPRYKPCIRCGLMKSSDAKLFRMRIILTIKQVKLCKNNLIQLNCIITSLSHGFTQLFQTHD